MNVCVEFKYECLLYFCYYYGQITHQSRLCDKANDTFIDFEGKYTMFEEWIRSNMNLKVSQYVKV